jgi:hypothetical protein
MSAKIGCLCLLLVVVSTWTDALEDGSFRVASPTGTPAFGQEVFPISRQFQHEIQERVEQPPLVAGTLNEECVAGLSADPFPSSLTSILPATFASSDCSCYVLMSLQR